MQNLETRELCKHRVLFDSKIATGQYGSSTVLQQVNVQWNHQCKWTDSWGGDFKTGKVLKKC